MPSFTVCSNCGSTQSRYKAVCNQCSYIMDRDQFEQKLQVAILNELRELNDKDPVTSDGLRFDDPIAALKRQYKDGTLDLDELEDALEFGEHEVTPFEHE